MHQINSKRRINYRWICATGGLNSFLVLGTATSLLPLTLVEIEKTLGISNAQAGAILAIYGIFFIIGAFLWGILANIIGLRNSLALSCLTLSIGTIGMGTMNSTIMGMVFYSIIGLGGGAPATLSVILVGAWFNERKRGLAQGYITSPRTLWAALLGLIVPTVMLAYGWRSAWYILGGLNLFLSALVFGLIKNVPQESGFLHLRADKNTSENLLENNQNQHARIKNRDILKLGITWKLIIIFFLNIIVIEVVYSFLVVYLITQAGLSSIAAGGAFSILTISMMAGCFVWAFLSDYIQRKYVLAAGSILCAVFILALTIGVGSEIVLTYVIVGGIGFAMGTPPVTFAMISDCFPSRARGTASGIINSVSAIGFAVGPFVAGTVAASTGSFIPVFAMVATVAVTLAIISLLIKLQVKNN
jgi:MFS family permease